MPRSIQSGQGRHKRVNSHNAHLFRCSVHLWCAAARSSERRAICHSHFTLPHRIEIRTLVFIVHSSSLKRSCKPGNKLSHCYYLPPLKTATVHCDNRVQSENKMPSSTIVRHWRQRRGSEEEESKGNLVRGAANHLACLSGNGFCCVKQLDMSTICWRIMCWCGDGREPSSACSH